MTTIRNAPPPTVAPPKSTGLAAAAPTTPEPLAEAAKSLTAKSSEFFNTKDRPMSLSGAFRGVRPGVNPDLPSGTVSELFKQLDAGKMQAGTDKKAKAPPPIDVAKFTKGLAGKSAEDIATALNTLPPGDITRLNAAITKGTVTDPKVVRGALNMMPPAELGTFLKTLPEASLKSLAGVMKTEAAMPIQNVGVAIELAARTPWGKANPKIVDDLRTRNGDFSKLTGANISDKLGMLGSFRDGVVKYDNKLLKHPEALAAVLAHEGTHAHQGTDCCGGEGPAGVGGEAAASAVTAQVWSELKGTNAPDPSFDGYAKAWTDAGGAKGYGALAVKERMLTKYLEHANGELKTRQTEEKAGNERANGDDTAKGWQAKVDKFSGALKVTVVEITTAKFAAELAKATASATKKK